MKIKLLLILCGLALLGCASDDDAFRDFSQISVEIQEGNSFIKKAEEKITLTVSLSSPEVLTSLEVFVNGQSQQIIPFEAVRNKTLSLDFETFKSEAGTSKFISFLATNETGGFGNAEVEIEVLATLLDFSIDTVTLKHYHADTTHFAFDLVNNVYTTDSAQADIWVNSNSGAWNVGIESFTSTQFVKVENPTEIDFNTISEEAISLIYEAGNPSNSLVGLSESDLLIAKLRNTNSYSIIEIKQVSALVGDNSEQIVLKYRKVAENSGQ